MGRIERVEIAASTGAGGTPYLPFVDGLRAVSILAVVAYHVGVPGVSGGYVGVDVFFVISGFLIISQIVDGLRGGTFTFRGFWAHRALRILPPYMLVLLTTVVLAVTLLAMPEDLLDFGRESRAAAVMLINHVLLLQQGYFDTAADTKILLHTWSLAVEEQFYLVAPLLLAPAWWLSRRAGVAPGKTLFWLGALVLVPSFVGCVELTRVVGRNFAFYLTPLRAWEFVIGGAIGFAAPACRTLPKPIIALLANAGLAAILAAVFLYRPDTPYPSWRVLLPVLGAAMTILAGLVDRQTLAPSVLSTRPMVWIGLISYAWYLWHWPLLAFGRILDFGERDLPRDLTLGAVSLGLAALTFYLVERPIRRWRQTYRGSLGWRPVAAGLTVGGVISVGCLVGFDALHARAFALQLPFRQIPPTPMTYCDLLTARAEDCMDRANGSPIGLAIGDSHMMAAGPAVAAYVEARRAMIAMIAAPGCMAAFGTTTFLDDAMSKAACTKRETNAVPQLMRREFTPKFALLYSRWSIYFGGLEKVLNVASNPDEEEQRVAALRDTVEQLRRVGVERILVLAAPPLFRRSVPNCLYIADRDGMDRAITCGIDRASAEIERRHSMERLHEAFDGLTDVRIVDALDSFCDPDYCLPNAGDVLYFYDTNHLTYDGAMHMLATHQADFDWLVGGQLDANG